MGFLAPAVPWIVKGGAMLGGALFGKKSQSSAMKRSPEEQMALQGAQQSSQLLTQQGMGLMNQGSPLLGQAGDYWSTLLRGSRPAMAQATAGPRAQITDIYRGAERGLQRSGIQGAQRDQAQVELNRDRAGRIAGLTTGMQPMAADKLAGIGGQELALGSGLLGQSGNIWGNLLGQGYNNRVYARSEGEKAGGSMGGLIFDILNGTIGKKGAFNPSTAKVPTGSINDIPKVLGPGIWG